MEPAQVAEAGSFGGGISSCLRACGEASGSCSGGTFAVLRLRPMFNFLRIELPDEGVSVSLGLALRPYESSVLFDV